MPPWDAWAWEGFMAWSTPPGPCPLNRDPAYWRSRHSLNQEQRRFSSLKVCENLLTYICCYKILVVIVLKGILTTRRLCQSSFSLDESLLSDRVGGLLERHTYANHRGSHLSFEASHSRTQSTMRVQLQKIVTVHWKIEDHARWIVLHKKRYSATQSISREAYNNCILITPNLRLEVLKEKCAD